MKKTTKSVSIFLTVIAITIIFQVAYSYFKIDNVLIYEEVLSQNEKVQNNIKNYKVVECNFGLINPGYAFVSFDDYFSNNIEFKYHMVTFYTLSRPHILSSNWQITYTGGTTIENTTFPQLVEMVKEDCSQFQESYFDESELGYTDDMTDTERTERWNETELKNINWTYSPSYPPTTEEKSEDPIWEEPNWDNYNDQFTEEELKQQEELLLEIRLDQEGYTKENGYTEEEIEEIKDILRPQDNQ